MATLPSSYLGESVDIRFDFDHALPVIIRFSLDISYYQSNVNAKMTDPSVSFDGVNFTTIVNNLFDVPSGKSYFVIRAKLNNDPYTRADDSVQVTVVPVTNQALITNPDGFTVIVELKTVSYKPKITVDAVAANIGEGSVAQAVFTFSSALSVESVFEFSRTFTGTASAADIGPMTARMSGGSTKNLLSSDLITAPAGTTTITVDFNVLNDGFNDGAEGVVVSLLEPPYQLNTLTRTPVTKTFTFVDTYVPPAGTLLRYYCTGKDQYGEYADGSGGVYSNLIKKNSVNCGYVIPPAGTLLSQHCAGYDKIGEYADGNDGSYFQIIALQDASCGYVPEAPNPQTELIPTKYDSAAKGATVTLSNGNRNFAGQARDLARTEFSAMYGKWYIEHTVLMPTAKQQPTAIGVISSSHPIANWIGSNVYGWAWWPHEGTKFHTDSQELFGPSLMDGDVIGILLNIQEGIISIQLNGVDVGVLYDNLTPFVKLYFVTSALDSSFAHTNFGQYVFKYPVPAGYYPGFGVPGNAPPERRTHVNDFCSGVDLWETLADGKGGTFTEKKESNVVGCGYVPPPTPAGTIIGYVCQGFDYYSQIADGNYGYTLKLISINSRSCGYTPPPVPAFTPTVLDTNFKSSGTTINANGYQAVPDGTVRSVASVYSGRWYWEVTSNIEAGLVGITTSALTSSAMLGSNSTSFAVDLATGEKITNGVRTAYMPAVPAGSIVRISIDFVVGSLSFAVDTNYYGVAFDNLTGTYYAAGSGSGVAELTFNFGDDTQVYPQPQDHISGFGVATTIYPKKGSYITYSCSGTTKNDRYADGGGGYYVVPTEKSPTCGYVPPKPAGTVVRDYCIGADKYTEYNDGNYGTYSTVTEVRSIACGYKPAGALISTYCNGYTKMGTYSDGEFGTYVDTIETFSRDCGYNVGGGGGSSDTTIDPNLVETSDGLILFDTLNNQLTGELVLDVVNPRPPAVTYPVADSEVSYFCTGSRKTANLADGAGGTYQKVMGWSIDCGPGTYFSDGMPTGYRTLTSGSTLLLTYSDIDSSVIFNTSLYDVCFVPGVLPSKTSGKVEIEIQYSPSANSNAPAVGFCLLHPLTTYNFSFFFTQNSIQFSTSNDPNTVTINAIVLAGTALPANALPTSGRQLFGMIFEPDGTKTKITLFINGVQVYTGTVNIPNSDFSPGIHMRSATGEILDFKYTDYP